MNNVFIDDIISSPDDFALPLIFSDYLEEMEDPRGSLLRYAYSVLFSYPARTNKRDDIKITRSSSIRFPYFKYSDWYELIYTFRPPHAFDKLGARQPWRGVHNAGHLLGCSYMWYILNSLELDNLALYSIKLLKRILTCYVLYDCRLLSGNRKEILLRNLITNTHANESTHSVLYKKLPSIPIPVFNSFVDLSNNSFSIYLNIRDKLTKPFDKKINRSHENYANIKALKMSQFVDIFELFKRTCPWDKFLEVHDRRFNKWPHTQE